jgi:hypothetical protein
MKMNFRIVVDYCQLKKSVSVGVSWALKFLGLHYFLLIALIISAKPSSTISIIMSVPMNTQKELNMNFKASIIVFFSAIPGASAFNYSPRLLIAYVVCLFTL